MKKIVAILLCLVVLFSLSACSSSKNIDDLTVSEIMQEISDGVDAPGSPMITQLDESTFQYFAFVPYSEGYEAVVWEAQIGSIAHSVVLVRVDDNTDVGELAKEIEANANPRKWICVEAEKTRVVTKDNMVLLLMSDEAIVDSVISNFNNL